MKIKLIHLNIERNKHLKAVSQLIESQKPDVMCMCEIAEVDANFFSNKFGYKMVYSPILNSDRGTYGSTILSKMQIIESSNIRYDDKTSDALPFVKFDGGISNGNRPKDRFSYHNSVLTATISNERGGMVTISTTHFPVTDHSTPGHEDHVFDETNDVREVNHTKIFFDRFMSIIKNLPYPLVFTADLNNPRGEYIYDALAHTLIDLTPSDIKSTLDPEMHHLKNIDLVVDTIMVSPDIQVDTVNVVDGVSDHKALISVLEV